MKKMFSVFLTTTLLTGSMFMLPVVNNNESAVFGSAYSYAITKTNYFSGSTGTMNSLGDISKVFTMSSPTLPKSPKTTTVVANVSFTSKGAPFYLYLQSPKGSVFARLISKSGEVKFDEFKDEDPNGKWKVYIKSTGGVSTGSARVKINYSYEQ